MTIAPERDIFLPKQLEEYRKSPNPELITQAWQTLWEKWGKRVGLKISVPPCEAGQEELEELRMYEYMPIYVPKELSKGENLPDLLRVFQLKIFRILLTDECPEVLNTITNEFEQYGWLEIEAEPIDTPYRIELWSQPDRSAYLESRIRAQNRDGQTFNTYLIGSSFSEMTAGFSFDSSIGAVGTCCLLLGSKINGQKLMVNTRRGEANVGECRENEIAGIRTGKKLISYSCL